jgi:nicotinamide-nucleotide amidase
MAKAEILSIGDELLAGRIADTNAQWTARQLSNLGITLHRVTTIPDSAEVLRQSLDLALSRSQIVILGGGLGPTKDDLTKHALTDYFGTRLVVHQPTLTQLEAWFERRGRVMNELNRAQALQPESARVLINPVGTAPGMHFTSPDGRDVISLPGVPHEMQRIMTDSVLPHLKEKYQDQHIRRLTLRTVGIPESELSRQIADLEDALGPEFALAYNPSLLLVDLRLSLTCPTERAAELDPVFDAHIAALRERLGTAIFADGDTSLEQRVGELLKSRGVQLVLAESCTGGGIGARIVSVPGSSAYFAGGVVVYSNEMKASLLGVDPALIAEHGAVSEPVARAMAEGARTRLARHPESTLALSVTGTAGPDGGTPDKPVGLVFIGLSDAQGTEARRFSFGLDRPRNLTLATTMALNMIRLRVLS